MCSIWALIGLLTLTRKSQCNRPHSDYILCFMLTPRGVAGFQGRREFGRGRRAVRLGCMSKSCLLSQAGGPMLKRSVPLKIFYSNTSPQKSSYPTPNSSGMAGRNWAGVWTYHLIFSPWFSLLPLGSRPGTEQPSLFKKIILEWDFYLYLFSAKRSMQNFAHPLGAQMFLLATQQGVRL